MSSESSYGFGQVPDLEKNGQGGFVRPEDPVAFVEAREQRVRDRFVNLHQAKLLREELRQCYYKSGVNHYQ
jgi:NADH dehydrogenase (ubiquinone) 1 beta subcomplex subunit 10